MKYTVYFATALLKISNIALIFLTMGRVVEKTAEDIMVLYLLGLEVMGSLLENLLLF